MRYAACWRVDPWRVHGLSDKRGPEQAEPR